MPTRPVLGVPELRVRDIMQHDVVTIPADATAGEAARLLWTRQIGGAPVLDDAGRVVGVVSTTDLLVPEGERVTEPVPHAVMQSDRAAEGPGWFLAPDTQLLAGEPPAEPPTIARRTRVRDLMTPATFSVRPEATIPELARFMLNAGIHRALVLEGEALTGIVTTFDVLRAVSGELRGADR